MKRYQKVLVCIFRSIGILLLGYGAVALLITALMMSGMAGMALGAFLPILAAGAVSYFAAVPVAKIITIGIDE
ncbi:hypothetical protein [Rariglobus hedericola]|uniref:Uncharacterized protein n=1 Tax=Rariglobus hedericola TaxID=2597822 RepID=A0A556QPU0_9BACT|nr:hypothetical protein [Rariglobus hedericola]TSJ78612.1 hypothetical protein FPL22_04730 [Rariglobus hedericola]